MLIRGTFQLNSLKMQQHPAHAHLYEYVGNSNNITETLQSKFKEIQYVMCLLLTVSEAIMICEQ